MTTLSLESPRAYARISLPAARLAVAFGAANVLLLAVLHVLEPEYAPSWRMISEYANGAFGWLTTLYFLSLALGCISLFAAIRREVHGVAGLLGLTLLAVAAFGMVLAASFAMDPITIRPEEGTFHGQMHAISALFGIPTLPIAAILLALTLLRRPAWAEARRPLFWSATFTWIGLVVMIASVAILLPQNGGFGPGAPIGWGNRLMMLAYADFVIVAGWEAMKIAHAAR
jgi:hypothetical protein